MEVDGALMSQSVMPLPYSAIGELSDYAVGAAIAFPSEIIEFESLDYITT